MRRVAVLVTLILLASAACTGADDGADDRSAGGEVNDLNLGRIESAVDESSPGMQQGDRLVDAATGVDGVLYLALRDADGHHRLISTRGRPDPLVLADESTVEGFAPTALAVDDHWRYVFAASGNHVLRFEDHRGAEGQELRVLRRGGAAPEDGSSRLSHVDLGPPRYMVYDGRTDLLYLADFCRVVRFDVRRREVADVVQVAGGPGADCTEVDGRVNGLAVDQRTGDVYVGRGDEVLHVGPDGALSPLMGRDDPSAPSRPVTGLRYGRSLAVSRFGDVVVNTSGSVLRVRVDDGSTEPITGIEETPPAAHSGRPTEALLPVNNEAWIGLDGAGNLYLGTRQLPGESTDNPVRIRRVVAAVS